MGLIKNISIMIADSDFDHSDSLKSHLYGFENFGITGHACHCQELHNIMEKQYFDLIFLDVKLAVQCNQAIFDCLQAKDSALIITAIPINGYVNFALKAFEWGAIDFITKPFIKERLRSGLNKAIRYLNCHRCAYSDQKKEKENIIKLKQQILAQKLQEKYQLQPKEITISLLVHQGMNRESIASHLGITSGTLKNHLKHIYAKTIEIYQDNKNRKDKMYELYFFLERM